MKRLTFEGNYCDISQCRELPCKYDGNCSQKQVWERLREYEDTGLYPESVEALKLSMMGKAISEITEFDGLPIDRLRELAEADKDGRVVVLPCNGYSDIDIVRNGISYKPDHWNIHLTAFAHGQNTPSGLKVGLFDIGEVEREMEEMEGKKDGKT